MCWGGWGAAEPCLLGSWVPLGFPSRRISLFLSAPCKLHYCLSKYPNYGTWWMGKVVWLEYYKPPKFSWWHWPHFLCLSTSCFPKNNTLILVDVVLVSLLCVCDGSPVRGKFPVRAIIQTEAWTICGYAQGIMPPCGYPLLSAKRQLLPLIS